MQGKPIEDSFSNILISDRGIVFEYDTKKKTIRKEYPITPFLIDNVVVPVIIVDNAFYSVNELLGKLYPGKYPEYQQLCKNKKINFYEHFSLIDPQLIIGNPTMERIAYYIFKGLSKASICEKLVLSSLQYDDFLKFPIISKRVEVLRETLEATGSWSKAQSLFRYVDIANRARIKQNFNAELTAVGRIDKLLGYEFDSSDSGLGEHFRALIKKIKVGNR